MEAKYHYYVAFEHRFNDVNEAFKFMGIKTKKAPKTNAGLYNRFYYETHKIRLCRLSYRTLI